jgi:hypothetical protein
MGKEITKARSVCSHVVECIVKECGLTVITCHVIIIQSCMVLEKSKVSCKRGWWGVEKDGKVEDDGGVIIYSCL